MKKAGIDDWNEYDANLLFCLSFCLRRSSVILVDTTSGRMTCEKSKSLSEYTVGILGIVSSEHYLYRKKIVIVYQMLLFVPYMYLLNVFFFHVNKWSPQYFLGRIEYVFCFVESWNLRNFDHTYIVA